MPLGLKRVQHSRQSHFITFSCYHRLPRFKDNRLGDMFLQSLEQTRQSYQFRVYGYVVMPEHVHLLVSEPESDELSKTIQALKISVARRALNLCAIR
jgi:putative transposase